MTLFPLLSIFFAGLLAGEELVVRYAVHPALMRLERDRQIAVRQALIRTLRILAPSLFLLTLATTVVALIVAAGPVLIAALVALGGWLLATALGTVPINIRVADWVPASPPADADAVLRRWAMIDIVRSSFAIIAFALVVLALAF